MADTVKGVKIDPVKEKLVELLGQAHNKATDASAFDGVTYAQQLEAEADYLIANGVTVREHDGRTVVLPRYGYIVKAAFSPGDIIGTLCIGEETYQIYLGGIETLQLGYEAESLCTTFGRIKRKFTLIEV